MIIALPGNFANLMGISLVKIKFCWCTILISLSFLLHAQPAEKWYLSKVLNDNNGLPQNSVSSMYFDRKTGFLWLTTEAGLVRYDGVNTRVFDLRDLASLKMIRIQYLFSTLNGEIFGVNRLGEIFGIKNNYVSDKVASISSYFNQYGNARSLADINFETTTFNRSVTQLGALHSSVWLNNRTWVALSKGKVTLFDNDKLTCQWPCEKGTFLVSRNGYVYVMNNDASGYSINLTDKKGVKVIIDNSSLGIGKTVLYYDKLNDQALVLNNNNLYELLFNEHRLSLLFVAKLKNLPTDITSVILHKNKKSVFVATNTTGVYIYRSSPFIVYKARGSDIVNNNYASVLADSNHIFSCRSILFDLNTATSRKMPVPINQILSMGLDATNNIWSAIPGHVISFNLRNPRNIDKYPLATEDYIQTFFLAANRKFWISTRRFFGDVHNKELRAAIVYENKSDSMTFYYLTETAGGRLVGVNRLGIYFIDTTSKKIIPVLRNHRITEVRNINIDRSGMWWITTYGKGIYVYDLANDKLMRLHVDDKGYLLYSHACIDDGRNNFLVPTNKGLFRLNKINLLQICKAPATPLYYQYFDVSSGLLTNEFNGGCQPAFNRMQGGDIILPALQGLVRVKVNELTTASKTPLFIDFVETRHQTYRPEKKMIFQQNERTQTWYVSVTEWDQPNSQGIFYQADNSPWQRLPSGERKIQLTELTGGDHSLKIRYHYGLMQQQFSSLEFAFFIPKKYYEQAWFWPAVCVVFAFIIFLLVRLRLVQQALDVQKIRNRISADMHDEIGSTLSSISFYSQALLLQTSDEKHRKVLEKIKENAQVVQEGLSDIVWSVKASLDGIEHVFSRMHSFGSELCEPKNIYFHFHPDEKLNGVKLAMNSRKNFYLIFKEALNNAAKYAECKNVWINIEAEEKHVRMEIKDDGQGFDVKQVSKGNGLSNMRNRATQMNGSLTIDSAVDKGTTITLIF